MLGRFASTESVSGIDPIGGGLRRENVMDLQGLMRGQDGGGTKALADSPAVEIGT